MAGSFAGSPERLVDAIAASLDVRVNAAVERIEAGAPGRLRVALASEAVEAEAVVLAVPAPEALRVAAPVLVAAERSILAGVRYDAAITWRAPLRDGAPREAVRVRAPAPFASIELRDGGLTAIARDPWAVAHLGVADDALAKELGAAVERVLPGVAQAQGAIARFPLAWPRFDVGHYRAIARLRAVEADRRAAGRPLRFAGDWLAAPTLEGACLSAGSVPPDN
jgi:predicted NAD/FAD-dependent oxidoreductase